MVFSLDSKPLVRGGRRLALAGLAALLAACASPDELAPQGQLTAPDALATQRSLAAVTHSKASWPDARWWHRLGDATLDQLVQEALQGSPDLATAQARARSAQAAAGLAEANRRPTVTATGSLSGAHLPGTVLPPPMGGHFGWLKYGYASAQWDADLWGGKRAAWAAAVGQAEAAEVDVHAARLALSTAVVRSWARLGYAAQQQELAQEELERARRARELTQQRVAAGISSRLQLKRSDAEVAQAEGMVARADRAVQAGRIAVARLLGQGPDRGLALQLPQPLEPARLALPPDVPSGLLGRRPDLVAARWRVEAAGHGIEAAKADFMPNIRVGALLGFAAQGSDTLLQLPAHFFQVAPALSLPVFDGGRLRARLGQRDADYDLAVADYNKTLVDAVDDVAGHASDLQALDGQLAAQQRTLDAARDAWELAEQRYRAGVGSFLEALGVRRDLLAAEQALAALQAEQVDASILLMQALGGGYEATGAPLAGVAAADAQTTMETAHHE